MPQASDELRRKWGGQGGVGDEKAIAFLEAQGYKLLSNYFWLVPQGHKVTDDESDAISFLIDEWDFGGAVR